MLNNQCLFLLQKMEGIIMALQTKKAVTLTGTSTIEGQQVVYLSANVTTDNVGNTSITQNIQNQSLYRPNREECRKDVDDFQAQVWEVEDSLISEEENTVDE